MERTGRKGDPNPRLYASRSSLFHLAGCPAAHAAAGRGSDTEGQRGTAGPRRYVEGQVEHGASLEASFVVEEQGEARLQLVERAARHDQEAVTRTCSRS